MNAPLLSQIDTFDKDEQGILSFFIDVLVDALIPTNLLQPRAELRTIVIKLWDKGFIQLMTNKQLTHTWWNVLTPDGQWVIIPLSLPEGDTNGKAPT